jgi:hypothetical protein
MRPYEILKALKDLPEDERGKYLKDIRPEHEFWYGCYHGLRQFAPYVTRFVVGDPEHYGPGVPAGVFAKIIDGMESGKLGEAVADALTAFSSVCIEPEWLEWYRPVLEKNLFPPFTVADFNKYCPTELQIRNFEEPKFAQVGKNTRISQQFFVEPFYPDKRQVLLFLRGRKMRMYLHDGTPVKHKGLSKHIKFFATSDGAVFDGYHNEGDDTMIVRDVLLWEQITGQMPVSGSTEERVTALRSMYQMMVTKEYPGMEAIEMYDCNSEDPSTTRENFGLLFQQGHNSVIIRGKGLTYFEDNANIVVHPTKRSILTCTKVTKGEEGSKYEGKVEYLHGSGTLNKKKFETPGLKFSDRESLLQDGEPAGRKFAVLSCGLAKDGKLMFPIFQEWRN